MSWSIGHDNRWGKYGRDIGYGVPAICDHPGCEAKIHRGLSYVCGGDPYGGEHGCGLHFCTDHLTYEDRGEDCPQLCQCCADETAPFDPKPDTAEWIDWKLTDESWADWRSENAEEVETLRAAASEKLATDAEQVAAVIEREGSRAELDPFRHDLGGRDNG